MPRSWSRSRLKLRSGQAGLLSNMSGLAWPDTGLRGLAFCALQSRARSHSTLQHSLVQQSTAGRQLDVYDPACAQCTADETRSPSLLLPVYMQACSTVVASPTEQHTQTQRSDTTLELGILDARRIDRRIPWQIPRVVSANCRLTAFSLAMSQPQINRAIIPPGHTGTLEI